MCCLGEGRVKFCIQRVNPISPVFESYAYFLSKRMESKENAMKTQKEKNLNKVFQEFLAEQQSILKLQAYSGSKLAIDYFERYLDGYGSENLTDKDLELYEELSESSGKEYCEIFGPQQLGLWEVENFLGHYMVLRIESSTNFLKIVGRVMHKLVKWLHDKGYMVDDDYGKIDRRVKVLKADLPAAVEVSDLMSEYASRSPNGKYTEELNRRFIIKKIKPGKLWFEDLKSTGKLIGPVKVTEEISSLCRIGWTVVLRIGKTGYEWKIIDSKAVYPMTEY
jgi:hypothetical protein